MAAAVLCCCICVLLPLVQGLDGQEIDLEFANHGRDTAVATADKVVSGKCTRTCSETQVHH